MSMLRMERLGEVVSHRINEAQIRCISYRSKWPSKNSTDRDVYYERTGGMEAQKYLRENCYHRIECSVANFLAVLMRKWSLNSVFQSYSYPQRFQEDADGTSINTDHPPYMWRVEMKGEDSIKEEGGNERRRSRN